MAGLAAPGLDLTFEAALKTVQGLVSGQLPPLVTVGATLLVGVLFLLTLVRQYLTGERPPNLLTPSEHRLRQKLATIHDLLERAPEPAIRDLLRDEDERLQFLLITGINAKAALRRQLWVIHQSGPLRFTWKELREALPFLRTRGGQLVQGIDWLDRVMLGLVRGLTVLCLVFAVLLMAVSLAAVVLSVDVLPMIILTGILLGLAFLLATLGLPRARATQFQRFLPAEHDPAEAMATPETFTPPAETIDRVAETQMRAGD